MINLFNDDFLNVNFSELPPINLVVTSPVYNVGINYDKYVDIMTHKDYLVWCEKWLTKLYNAMPDDGRLCINVSFTITADHLTDTNGSMDNNFPLAADYIKACEKIGFKYWRTVIWDKNHSNKTCWGSWRSASSPFMRDPSESILVFYKKQWKRLTRGISTIEGQEFMDWTKNVWKMHPETKSKHPAAFPIELPNRCIKLFSYQSDTVLDCFMGSGTAGESAVRLGRSFVGIEKSKEYFNMAKERIEAAELQTSLIKQIIPILPIDHKTDATEMF